MISTSIDRISALNAEIQRIKYEQRHQKAVAKAASLWVNIQKRMPEQDVKRVLAWANGKIECCWFAKDKFYVYNGTWFYMEKDRLDGVTYWMARDWMYSDEWPKYGPGLKNRLRYLFGEFTDGATDLAHGRKPSGWYTTAQLSKKPTFFVNRSTGEVMTGGPEHIKAPRGYERVVCTKAYEAEQWSERQRHWDKSKHSKLQEERARVEEPIHAEIRAEMHHRMANARNSVNREFMRRAIEKSDSRHAPWQYERESYMHSEGFEQHD